MTRPAADPRPAGNSDQVPHRLLNVKEVASRLGCSWRTALRHADAGLIPFGIKLGGLRRWDVAELDDFIANGCKPPRPARGRS
jgi:excisionase family DNA binding protein